MMDIIEYLMEQGIEINEFQAYVYKRSKISNICKDNQELIFFKINFSSYIILG